MKRTPLWLAVATSLLLSTAGAAAEMGGKRMGGGMGMMDMPMMQAHMSQMQEHMRRIKSAKSDPERLRLMQEHMEMMHAHMSMMMQMMGGDRGAVSAAAQPSSDSEHEEHHPR